MVRDSSILNPTLCPDRSLCIDKDAAWTMSFSCSTRSFYNLKPEGVPFDWEKRPGTPKNSSKEDVIPPLSPPPAQFRVGLSKPCVMDKPKVSSKSRLSFWKIIHVHPKSANQNVDHNMVERSESCISDNIRATPRNSRCSSALSSNGRRAMETKSEFKELDDESSFDPPKGCVPWGFRTLVVYIAKRIWHVLVKDLHSFSSIVWYESYP